MKLVEFSSKKGKAIFINPDKVCSVVAYGLKATMVVTSSSASSVQIVYEDIRSVVAKLQS